MFPAVERESSLPSAGSGPGADGKQQDAATTVGLYIRLLIYALIRGHYQCGQSADPELSLVLDRKGVAFGAR